MTDQERKMLKSYLTECLEPRLRTALELMQQYSAPAAKAENTAVALAVVGYYRGQRDGLQHAINDFRELFEEDLKEGE